jgi:beta-galactosidase
VAYSPGILKAVGVRNDKEVESTVLKTSGNAAKILVRADRKKIMANGQDLSYVTIEIADKDNVFQPNAASRLHFNIGGPGAIAGVANADMKDTDPYVGNAHKAWHGRALVVIRSTHEAGSIQLTISSPGLSEATLNIESVSENTLPASK